MKKFENILITGITGLIGKIVFNDLKKDYPITGLSLEKMDTVNHFQANIDNLEEIMPAFRGQDAVIHLSADASDTASWESTLPNNIIGTYNVYEAARQNDVKRIIFASSNHTTGMFENDHPYHHIVNGEYNQVTRPLQQISHTSEVRPDGYYGVSKAYGEDMGRYYSEQYGISVIALRIGTCNAHNQPKNIRHFATWLSHRDQAQLVRKSLQAPETLMFDIFYGVSRNKWRFWDIEHGEHVIGYDPKDNAENYRSK